MHAHPIIIRPLLLLLVTMASLGLAALEQYPVNFCTTYQNLCSAFQTKVFCPDPVNQVNCEGPVAPSNHPTYASYAGRCECGALNATRLEQQIVYHEIGRQQAQQSLLVANADGMTTDFCASYTNTCNAFLNAVACPPAQQVNQGCTEPGNFQSFVNQCSCGNIDGSLEARNSIIVYLELNKVKSLTSFKGESEVVELCPTFDAICGSFLDDIACPAADRVNVGCLRGNDYETYQGACMCGQVDAGDRVRRLVIDQNIGGKILMISDSFINTDGTLDLCNTFSWACSAWLDDTIQCPAHLKQNENGCGTASGTDVQDFKGTCTCGDIVAHQRIQDIIIDVQMNDELPNLLCGTNGACHPRKEIVLVRSKIPAGGVFGLLVTTFIIVVLTGAFFPGMWTFCARESSH